MPRHVAALISLPLLALTFASPALAQGFARRPMTIGEDIQGRGGRVYGVVRDDSGQVVTGASVVAIGTAPSLPLIARSDRAGHFSLPLPSGTYILRASRDGYVSTYREAVRIQSAAVLVRNITLVRQGSHAATKVLLAGAALVPEPPVTGEEGSGDDPSQAGAGPSPSETVWRLRHLPPTALRDIAVDELLAGRLDPGVPDQPPLDAGARQTRTAGSLVGAPAFTGQVNFLRTSSFVSSAAGPSSGPWSQDGHGIAYIVVGAPVGTTGDVSVRGAMTAGRLPSWVVLGEYAGRRNQVHAIRVGVSYGSQVATGGGAPALALESLSERARSVGGMYGSDRWQVRPALMIEYGLNVDRYDYVTEPLAISPRMGLHLAVRPRTRIVLLASESGVRTGERRVPATVGRGGPVAAS